MNTNTIRLASYLRWTLVALQLLLVVACSANSTPSPMSESTLPASSATIYFPQQRLSEGEQMTMTAQLFGTLVTDQNCLRVENRDDDLSYLIIWPPNFSLNMEMNPIQIYNADGQMAVQVGDNIYLGGGGGDLAADSLAEQVQEPEAIRACSGPYWIVGQTVERIEESE